MFGAGIDVEQAIEQARQRQGHEQQGKRQRHIAKEVLGGIGQLRYQFQPELDDQRRCGLRQAVKHLVVAQVVEPFERRLAGQQARAVQDQKARQAADYQGNQQQHGQADGGVEHGVLVEGAPQVEGVTPDSLDIHGLAYSLVAKRSAIRARMATKLPKEIRLRRQKTLPYATEFPALA
ncbi:hypothetical protein D3C78_765570 [compost metagenome]